MGASGELLDAGMGGEEESAFDKPPSTSIMGLAVEISLGNFDRSSGFDISEERISGIGCGADAADFSGWFDAVLPEGSVFAITLFIMSARYPEPSLF